MFVVEINGSIKNVLMMIDGMTITRYMTFNKTSWFKLHFGLIKSKQISIN